MTILDEFITLLVGNEDLRANHPVFVRLSKNYPLKFKAAAHTVANVPLESVILWVSSQHPSYKALLDDPTNGPYLKQRLGELQEVQRRNHTRKQSKHRQRRPPPQVKIRLICLVANAATI